MAMALHPDKQLKAQAEIDRVIGTERMPTVQDFAALPYTSAVIKETMRWHPALPLGKSRLPSFRLSIPIKLPVNSFICVYLGVSRRTARDDDYDGYHIPQGTIVIPNVW